MGARWFTQSPGVGIGTIYVCDRADRRRPRRSSVSGERERALTVYICVCWKWIGAGVGAGCGFGVGWGFGGANIGVLGLGAGAYVPYTMIQFVSYREHVCLLCVCAVSHEMEMASEEELNVRPRSRAFFYCGCVCRRRLWRGNGSRRWFWLSIRCPIHHTADALQGEEEHRCREKTTRSLAMIQ